MTTELLKPILDDGIRNVHFFNGRVLTGEAMQAEQKANRRHRWNLGRAIGEGVVEGLDVRMKTGAGPRIVVTVGSGSAINRKGQFLSLSKPIDLSIVTEDDLGMQGDGIFADCMPTGTFTPTGNGVYALVLAPASALVGQAPRVGLADGVARTCESRYAVEGVTFRLLHVDVESDVMVPESLRTPIRNLTGKTTLSVSERSMLRNLLAHLCLGTVEANRFVADALGQLNQGDAGSDYGPLDRLRALDAANKNRLTGCDVPLALLYWSQHQIEFVDGWSLRRRVHRRATSSHPPFPSFDRRSAESEAAFLQFQDQLAALIPPGTPPAASSQIQLANYFRFVPAVGIIPERVGTAPGVTHVKFFDGLTFREPVFIEGARTRRLLRISFDFDPVDLEKNELIWLYRVRENRHETTGNPQAYLIFAGGHIPYQGDPQYDLSRWSFSNYGPGVAGLITTGE